MEDDDDEVEEIVRHDVEALRRSFRQLPQRSRRVTLIRAEKTSRYSVVTLNLGLERSERYR